MQLNRNFYSNNVLSLDEIRRRAPSVFATAPSEKVSDRYLFVPTSEILSGLEREGFQVVKAMQSHARTPEGRSVAKHMLRLRHRSTLDKTMRELGDSIPEIVIANSHNGTSAYDIMLGVYRLVCSNGMIAGNTLAHEKVRHTGDDVSKVIEASYRVLGQESAIIGAMDKFRSINLEYDERLALARAAQALKWDPTDTQPEAVRLLAPRREADRRSDLWTTFNVLQENMLKGGVSTVTRDLNGRVRRNSTREVASVTENKRLNQGLWTLAEEMAKLKGAA
jgi:hypothetical protein